MKLYRVVEALIPVANEIYDKVSLDVMEIANPSNRVIAAPGEFTLGEELTENDFAYDVRGYLDDEGNEIHGTFAVRRIKPPHLKDTNLYDHEMDQDPTEKCNW